VLKSASDLFRVRRLDQIDAIRASIARVGGLSDNLVKVGPLRLGVDGLLAWVPFLPAGAVYSLGAGIFLIVQGYRARAPAAVLVQAAGLIAARTLVTGLGESVVPLIVLELAVDLFRAHKWSADLLSRAIDQTHYVEGPADSSNPHFIAPEVVRAQLGKRWVVYLG